MLKTTFSLICAALTMAAAMQFLSCTATGPGGQKALILFTTDQEVAMGVQMDQQLRQTEKILPDTMWQNYLAGVGQKIVAVSDRKDLTFHFAVIESDQINAFATPGGYVYFYTGILREMDTESEMAAVMAHEISHVVARHGIRRMQTAMGATVLLDLALGGKSENTKQLAQTGLGLVMTGYSRSQESEADNFGITYMTRAGWDPHGAIAMFEKLAEMSGGQGGGVFESLTSDHPDTQSRINAATAEVAKMSPLPAKIALDSPKYQAMKKRLPPPKPAAPVKK
jgi:predicted Zn-dependent protease